MISKSNENMDNGEVQEPFGEFDVFNEDVVNPPNVENPRIRVKLINESAKTIIFYHTVIAIIIVIIMLLLRRFAVEEYDGVLSTVKALAVDEAHFIDDWEQVSGTVCDFVEKLF